MIFLSVKIKTLRSDLINDSMIPITICMGSNPNGGFEFQLWLGFFATEEERDKLVHRTKRVIFRNRTTGSIYIITKADKYLYLGTPSAEFDIWFGHQSMVIGDRDIIVQFPLRLFTRSFTITQEMLDQIPPKAVNPKVLLPVDGFFDIIAKKTNGDVYCRYRKYLQPFWELRFFRNDETLIAEHPFIVKSAEDYKSKALPLPFHARGFPSICA